ncbi:NAD-dependent succinate-semialdehyde dehydrogenase [Colwellia sp. D2M02]|uniref:NAD-dependent succinate-semialdehyde dehydrogenase n=1 Tax=Colwellia sp. D2M02 TaxID=2841562 RepID=UPI001C08960B|nr:NAD-dependent succinate-semialdehyde dehydrogenase [Colwellia sp. D2M02]MBU2894893.1 NAD-dependent succinate-semialdehyde dehydrogenase [Colwellia sp. D2M02]
MTTNLLSLLQDKALLKTQSYINGQWHKNDDSFQVMNPATNTVIAQVNDDSVAAVLLAIDGAKNAFKAWSKKSANERAQLLQQWFTLIEQHQEDLAYILTVEQGKPLAEARGEIAYGASYIQWFAEEGKRAYGDIIPASSSDKRIAVIKEPIGVVSAITPWNFPHAMLARKAAAALAAGCTFIGRPSELTPLSALALAVLSQRAGIPAGVFNVVVGTSAQQMGELLSEHKDIAKLSFTGSTRVGKLLAAQCASSVKKVSLELGGNAPFIVFDDADIDAAVKGAMAAKFRNAGQTCVCANRIFLQATIADEFTEKFTTAVNALAVGNGLEEKSAIGPLINEKAVIKVKELVDKSITLGAKIVYQQSSEKSGGGSFFNPLILSDVHNHMDIAQEEIFGPVASLITFNNETEVIAMANDTPYGLAAYFYSQNINRIWRVAEQLHFGMVGINEGAISNAAAPFGGVKESGYGREGSKYGLAEYMTVKSLSFGGLG